ncbi:hypothetical protein GCM10027176_38270 [Actinoallomurus bryophytorum]
MAWFAGSGTVFFEVAVQEPGLYRRAMVFSGGFGQAYPCALPSSSVKTKGATFSRPRAPSTRSSWSPGPRDSATTVRTNRLIMAYVPGAPNPQL